MKTVKRLIALILVLASLFCVFSLDAFADYGLYWSVSDGVLIISGKGAMPDYSADVAPWRAKDAKARNITTIYVDDGVTYVGSQCFQYCEKAGFAFMADSVTSIGEAAFYGCKDLVEVCLPNNLRELSVSLFDHCSSLEYVYIPSGVKTIRNAAFNCCTSLETVCIPKSVTVIEDSAFNSCRNLTDVYYEGSWSDWDRIDIAGYNRCLTNATIHFNCDSW